MSDGRSNLSLRGSCPRSPPRGGPAAELPTVSLSSSWDMVLSVLRGLLKPSVSCPPITPPWNSALPSPPDAFHPCQSHRQLLLTLPCFSRWQPKSSAFSFLWVFFPYSPGHVTLIDYHCYCSPYHFIPINPPQWLSQVTNRLLTPHLVAFSLLHPC